MHVRFIYNFQQETIEKNARLGPLAGMDLRPCISGAFNFMLTQPFRIGLESL